MQQTLNVYIDDDLRTVCNFLQRIFKCANRKIQIFENLIMHRMVEVSARVCACVLLFANLLGCYRLNVQITHEIGWKCEIPKNQIIHTHTHTLIYIHTPNQQLDITNSISSKLESDEMYAIATRYTILIESDRWSLWLFDYLCKWWIAWALRLLGVGPKQFKSSVNKSRRHLPSFDYNLLMYTSSSHMISLKKPFIFAI